MKQTALYVAPVLAFPSKLSHVNTGIAITACKHVVQPQTRIDVQGVMRLLLQFKDKDQVSLELNPYTYSVTKANTANWIHASN